jgi:hypothetical protein
MLCLRETALVTLRQWETRLRALLASFVKRYEKLISDHPDVKKKMNLVRASVVQIGQLVQNSPEMNKNCAKWEQLADKDDAYRHNLCKFLDGQELFTGLISHVCSSMHGNEGQPSADQQGIRTGRCFASRTKQTPKERQNLWR